ncbi:phage distal tail protein [Streptomyces canus]|uniref:phage distal tail protein n=1 Tax=Streptomyces canus TaxID=58343 RepID=UPI002252BBCB|nr:phage tail domain-containing protein [Streptomyces canus]MCX4858321.1 phage tail family protein [Streptomyces canus]
MTALGDYQLDVGGLVIGTGTLLPVGEVTGLGAPDRRTADVDNPTDDGGFPGVDLFGTRTVSIEAGIRTPDDPGGALDLLAELQQVTGRDSIRKTAGALAVLRAKWPGRDTRRLYGRWRRVEAVSMSQAVYGWIPLTLEFTATDPRWHADDSQGLVLPLDISNDSQGFVAPLVAPITTGVSNPSERPGWVSNSGDVAAWPQLRIDGPVSNPKVWVVETGRYMQLQMSLAAGEWIDIDTRPGTRWVLRNGSGNAAPALTSGSRMDLFQIPPGRSEIRWTATDYTNTCRLTLSWRDAYTAL